MMKRSGVLFGLLALLIAESSAAQTNYPEKPIHLVVGFPPGSPPDTFARLFGQRLTEAWGKSVLVENIAGAAGLQVAADQVFGRVEAARDFHGMNCTQVRKIRDRPRFL